MFLPKHVENLLPTPNDIERLTRQGANLIAHWVADHPDSFTPHLIVEAKTGPDAEPELCVFVLAVDFNEDDEKRAILKQIGRSFWDSKKFPIGIVLCSECWVAERAVEAPHIEPRHDPNRREALVAFSLSMCRRIAMTISSPVDRCDGKIAAGQFGELQRDSQNYLLHAFYDGFYEVGKQRLVDQARERVN